MCQISGLVLPVNLQRIFSGAGPLTPVSDNSFVDFGMELHPPSIFKTERLPHTNFSFCQMGTLSWKFKTVIVPLETDKGIRQAVKERIAGSSGGDNNFPDPFFLPHLTVNCSAQSMGQKLCT